MNEYVFLGVVSVDKSVSGFYVKPFDGAWDFGGDDFFGFLIFINGIDAALKWQKTIIRLFPTFNQNLQENWVSKQSFFVLILTTAKKYFFRNKTFLFFNIESWNLETEKKFYSVFSHF